MISGRPMRAPNLVEFKRVAALQNEALLETRARACSAISRYSPRIGMK